MGKIKEKVFDWKERLKDRHMLTLVVTLVSIIVILGIFIYKKQMEYHQTSENSYNMAFYQLVEYVNNTEKYLAKSIISSTPEHGADTLSNVWREADLAQSYLSRLPIASQELENTQKFLHQVSDYSYSLSRKNINGEALSKEDFDNLTSLHRYSVDLENTLNQLSEDLNSGNIKWGELAKKGSQAFGQTQNVSKDSFGNIEENLHQYSGLIYDGAFSEHMTNLQRVGLTGDDIDEERAKQIAIDFVGQDKAKQTSSNGFSENANIPSYNFEIKTSDNNKDKNSISISVSKKGGHIVFMNYNRDVVGENIDIEKANEIGKEFLEKRGFKNMRQTYYLKQDGVVTINYAYTQNDIIMYPDLIKLKLALDNGEVLGIETTGYLNSHKDTRQLNQIKLTKEEAKQNLNKNLEIKSEGLAVIPTKWQTEILCWEFKGKAEDNDFLVYINVETGKEEDVLMIIDTPNGILTT